MPKQRLNEKQSDKLAGFVLDVTKGVLLGGFAITITAPFLGKVFVIIFVAVFSTILVKFSLDLLN